MSRFRAPRKVAIGTALLAIVGGAAWLSPLGSSVGRAPSPAEERGHVLQPRPFAATLNLVGTVTPGDSVEVTAPFDGVIREAGVDYGRAVEAGQVLVVLDPAELERHRREAEAATLKAEDAQAEMAGWATGPEVARARRAVASAESALQATRRKEGLTKRLFDQGLVARMEYEELVRERESQTMALATAREDLAAALRKGEGAGRRVLALELQNARVRLADLTAQLGGAVVKAPADGVILRPATDKSDREGGAIHVGQHLTRGQLIGSIARPDHLAITVKLDEADANRVRDGQPALVTGPGFPGLTLAGQVARVAGEASAPGPGQQQGSSFAVTVRLEPLSAERARTIRIGMTANVAITIHQAPSALVVPPQAIGGGPLGAVVMVRDAATGAARPRPVEIGAVAPDGVEIRSGLDAGDVVVWTPAPP